MAALVVVAALRLATQSIDVLMDRTVADADERIRAALAQAEEQVEVRRVRVRQAGGRHFVDLVVGVPLDTGVRQAHTVADRIEEVVERALGGADVIVHVEPTEAEGDIRERATAAAGAVPEVREVHNVRVMRLPDGYELSLHVKLPRELSLEEAHGVVERLEERVRAEVPELRTVHTHIEPLSRTDWASTPPSDDTATERAAIESAVKRFTGIDPLDVTFRDGEQGRVALVTVGLPGDAAAAVRAPARGRDRGGRARALPRPRRRDRAHRADEADGGALKQVDGGRGAHRQQHAGVAVVAARAAAAARRSGRSRRSRARRFGPGARGYSDRDGRHAHAGARSGAAPRAVRRRPRRRPARRRGSLAGASDDDYDGGRELGELARRLFEEVDRATRDGTPTRPSRSRSRCRAGRCTRRARRAGRSRGGGGGALSSLMLYDLRAVLGELEGGPPISALGARRRPGRDRGARRGGAADAGARRQ